VRGHIGTKKLRSQPYAARAGLFARVVSVFFNY